MKNTITLLFILLLPSLVFSQQTITSNLTHDSIDREFIIYIPASYTGDTPVPLVFNFHGYTSNASEQMNYGDFRPIADTANFIVVHPEGTLFDGNTHFNVGGFTAGSTVDDVGFTAAMIEQLEAEYNIDSDRIYSTGMSNGGFMSFLLACQLSDKIAAIASVTGSMTPETYDACDPQHPTPVLQIHGTTDAVVPYLGAFWSRSIDDVVDYWVGFNNCSSDPTVDEIPNTSTIDLSSAEHFVHDDGDNGATTEHIKITGGGHTWPGTAFVFPGTNLDFNASVEVWKFFSRYDINGEINPNNTDEVDETEILFYPNPTNSFINVEFDFTKKINYEVVSVLGEVVLKGVINSGKESIDLSALSPNVYFLKIGNRVFKVLKTK